MRSITNSHLSLSIKALLVFLTALLVVLTMIVGSPAQDSLDQVHIVARSKAEPGHDRMPTLRATVEVVLVNVTVLDHSNNLVTGLEPDNFTIFDNSFQQRIRYFSCEDAPISLAVVIDASESMKPRMEEARQAVIELFKSSNSEDDFSVITVSTEPRILIPAGEPLDDINTTLASVRPTGATALWDSMYLGLTELKKARYPRRAMIVISDGGDNRSRYTLEKLKSTLQEADVQVYAFGMFSWNARARARTIEEQTGPLKLDEVTAVTGGRLLPVTNRAELIDAAHHIGRELRNQYLLGYSPSTEHDGHWRKIQIRVKTPATREKVRVYAKKGYYGPQEADRNPCHDSCTE